MSYQFEDYVYAAERFLAAERNPPLCWLLAYRCCGLGLRTQN
jgi:hypothetical protein